jgi:hypothetical protein
MGCKLTSERRKSHNVLVMLYHTLNSTFKEQFTSNASEVEITPFFGTAKFSEFNSNNGHLQE